MRQIKIILFVAIITALTSGCRTKTDTDSKQEILFQMEYRSYSPTLNHRGYIIDGDGNVLVYNNPDTWYYPDKDLRIAAGLVGQDIAECHSSGIKISKEELSKYSSLINNLAESKVSAVKTLPEETGTTQYICYEYIENSGIYQGTVIKMEGDIRCENLNFFTKKVVDWMKDIHDSLADLNTEHPAS